MSIYERIIKTLIYLTVFLVPIFFFPLLSESFDFPKMQILLLLSSLAFIAWIAKMIQEDKKFKFYRNPMDLAILAFAVVSIISSYFSIDRNISLFGFYGRFFPSLIGVISLILFYFLLVQNLLQDKIIKIKTILKIFFSSAFLSVLAAYGSIFGVWAQIAIRLPEGIKNSLPPLFFQPNFNLTSASLESLSFFLLPLIIFLVIYWSQTELSRGKSLKIIIATVLFFGILAFSDFYLVWLAAIVSLVFFLAFALKKKICRPDVNKLLFPIILLIVSGFLFISNPAVSFSGILGNNIYYQRMTNLPKEILPNSLESYKASFQQLIKKPILGSGLGNYYYSFNKYKSPTLSEGYAWQLRFDRPSSHFAEVVATQGILGSLSFLFLVGLFIFVSYLIFENAAKNEDRVGELKKTLKLPIIFSAFTFIIVQFFYYQNLPLAFGFWLFLALSVVVWEKPIKEKEFSFTEFPELSLIFSIILILIVGFFAYCYYWQARIVVADYRFRQATLGSQEPNFDLLINVEKLNPKQAIYYLNDGRLALNQALKEVLKPANEVDSNKAQVLVARAIQKSRFAYDMAPNLINICENLGVVYRDAQGLAKGADEWAKKTFESCLELEPNNPLFYIELGKMEFETDIAKAKEYFSKAIEKKKNYLPSYIQYALVLEKEGSIDEAIGYLEGKINDFPLSADLKFQIGRFYYNKGDNNKAINYFKEAIALVSNHSNAIYSLGLAYEKVGNTGAALEQFKKVLELNPENKEIKDKVNKLTAPVVPVEKNTRTKK
ncbi:MAG: tetratricopeptide repeat protein [bacterium]|nr:tetratricopeptide repeat protein [bacterium]